jgi:hypothetical protein
MGNPKTPVQPSRRGILRLLAAALTSGGCGYSIRAPYDTSIQTVHVPMFRSISFRRDLQLQLTELVIKEIEKRTPYKVVGTPKDADTILEGTIAFADKNTVVENPQNMPRQLTTTIQATVNWVHNPPLDYETKRPPTTIAETVNFAPEIGESTLTSFYRTCQNLATQIVDMMESPWTTSADV